MRVLAVLVLAVAVTARVAPLSERELQTQFTAFMTEYSKQYVAAEFFERFNAYKYWINTIAVHNAGNHTWEMGINEFSDMMPAEFNRIYLSGLDLTQQELAVDVDETADLSEPNDVDWRSKGAVTSVKNQGQCGSCWAFSATGAMEGYTKVKGGALPNLSEQQLVDCAGSAGNHGCNGGWPSSAIKWVGTNGGICSQSGYPYTGRDGSCKKTCSPVAKVGGARTGSGESALGSQLNSMPVSIALDASGGFQSYKGGVFSGPCGTQLNHAVLTVGLSGSYWIVKNSWGGSWGSGGYIYMAKGKNLCGMGNSLAWPQ